VRYALAPAISVTPSISGSTSFGETLTATSGTWLYTPTSYGYQWSRAATSSGTYTNISGATNSSYKLVAADVDQFLKVTVSATNSGGTTTSESSVTPTISRSNVAAAISIVTGALVYRQIKTITATSTVAGKVTFKVNGKRVPGCISKSVSNLNSYIATCDYKPSRRGEITITTSLNPTDPSYAGITSSSAKLYVSNRSGTR
jgi:hypothetical protein